MSQNLTHPLTSLFVAMMTAAGFTVSDVEVAELAVRDAVADGSLPQAVLYVGRPFPSSLAEARAELEADTRYTASLIDYLYGNGRTPDLYSQSMDVCRLDRAQLLAVRAEVVVAALSARELAVTA